MNPVDTVIYILYPNKNKLSLKCWQTQMKILLNISANYCTHNIQNNENSNNEQIRSSISLLKNIQLINWNTTKILDYKRLDSNQYFNVELKPLKNFPKISPLCIQCLGLIGIWKLIDFNKGNYTHGDSEDILRSLKLLNDFNNKNNNSNKRNRNAQLLKSLITFFKESLNNVNSNNFLIQIKINK